jgi:hypothetical protein
MPTPDGRLNEVEPDWFDLPDLREPPGHPVAIDAALFGTAAPAGAEVATVAPEMQSPAETEPAVLPLIVDADGSVFDTEDRVDEDGAVGSGDDERGRRRVLVAAAVLALLSMAGTTLGVMAFTGSDASQLAVETDRDVTTTTAPTPTTTSPPTTTPETAPPSSNPPTASSVPTRRAPTTTRSVPPPDPAATQAAPPPPPPPPPDPPPPDPSTTTTTTTAPPTT